MIWHQNWSIIPPATTRQKGSVLRLKGVNQEANLTGMQNIF